MKLRTMELNLTENQINEIKKELLEPNNIKHGNGKKYGLFAQPNIWAETLSIRLLNQKEFNIINKACTKLKKKIKCKGRIRRKDEA